MYLNKILFPAPHCNYKAKQFENELLWVTRDKRLKGFKIDRKRDLKIEEGRKTQSHPHSSKFMGLFKYPKSNKEHLKQQQKIINNLNLETGSCGKYTVTLKEIEIPRQKEADQIHFPMSPQFSRVSSTNKPDMTNSPQLEPVHRLSEDLEIESRKDENKSKKKKKNKATCLSFFPKIHKGKKITLEAFDENNGVPPPFNLDSHPELKKLGPEQLAQAFDTEKESSSDSEDESTNNPKKVVNIPCLYLKARIPTTKTLLYFHGNGEDLYTSYDFLQHLSNNLMINLVAMEYPGYGIYPGSPSEKKVLIDAETVYNHLTNNMKIKEEDIYIFGRSIGSGPATWLASIKNPGLLILMSAFTSIRAVAKHIGGNLAKYLVKERFNNVEFMEDVRCPVLFIHGKKDNLIPHTQSLQLYGVAKGKKKIHLAEEMTHSDFDFFGDITGPLTSWMKELNLSAFPCKEQDIIKPKEDIFSLGNLKLCKQNSARVGDGYTNVV